MIALEEQLPRQRIQISDGIRAAIARRRERLGETTAATTSAEEKKPGTLVKLRRSLSAKLLRGDEREKRRQKRFTSLIAKDIEKREPDPVR